MKLITEMTDSVQFITEDKEGKKNYHIEGVFMQSGVKNRNGRIYPTEILAKEVDRYSDVYVNNQRAMGELGHPDGPTVNLERVSHIITGLDQDGDNINGKAKILDTPYGNIVKNLIDEGAQLGVSSRGMGTLREKAGCQVVQDDFMLSTAADIVADPSAPQAFVNGVMEGVDWVYDAASGHFNAMKVVEETKELGRKSSKELQESALRLFDKYLKSL